MIRLNLLLLMVVAFLPFPTSLVAEALDKGDAEKAAVLFYGANLFVISVLMTAMGRYALLRGLVLDGRRDELEALSARTAPSLGFYAALIALALLVPAVAAFGFLGVALLIILRGGVSTSEQ